MYNQLLEFFSGVFEQDVNENETADETYANEKSIGLTLVISALALSRMVTFLGVPSLVMAGAPIIIGTFFIAESSFGFFAENDEEEQREFEWPLPSY